MSDSKVCFLLCPIGDEGSETRGRADAVFEQIIKPVVSESGYGLKRADKLAEPGNISIQAIHLTLMSDLILADLSDHNPNVFYELAIRHFSQKPIIYLIESSQKIPFYLQHERIIMYDLSASGVRDAIDKLREFMKNVDSFHPTDPVSTAFRDFDENVQDGFRLLGVALSSEPEKQISLRASFSFYQAGFSYTNAQLQIWNYGDVAREMRFDSSPKVKMRLHPATGALSNQDKDSRVILEPVEKELPRKVQFSIHYKNSRNQTLTDRFWLDWDSDPVVTRIE